MRKICFNKSTLLCYLIVYLLFSGIKSNLFVMTKKSEPRE